MNNCLRCLLLYSVYIFILGLISSCSSTKFVGDKEFLLDRVIVKSDNRRYTSTELKPYLHQQPNIKAFGLVKWQLYLYGWSGKNPDGLLNRIFRKIGEPPIVMDTLMVDKSKDELKRFLENKGYVNAEVKASIDTSRRKKAVITYNITSNEPYVIGNYTMQLNNTEVDSIAHVLIPSRTWLESTFRMTQPEEYVPAIKEGNLFDRDLLDKERSRITTLLRRNGYFAFNRDNLGYVADSSLNRNSVNLEMVLYPYRHVLADGTVVELPHRPYYIKDVTILTGYDPLGLSDGEPFTPTDSLNMGQISIVYGKRGRSLRPKVLMRSNYLIPGERFNDRSLDQTYSSFAAMPALRNASVRFREFEENDSMKLHATILTSPAKVHGFGAEIEGTNSAGDFGAAASMNYRHRNLFKGSETFSLRVRGAYEALSGVVELAGNSYWEVGAETSLSFPQFLFPFVKDNFRKKIHASTDFRMSYSWQTRPEYERAILSGRWGYNWQGRYGSMGRHSFNLLDINYLFLPRINKAFLESLPITTQQYNYSELFIVSSGYTYSFNSYNSQYSQRNTHSIRFSAELAGNVMSAFSSILQTKKNNNGRYSLFGIEFSQYAKLDFDISRGIAIDNRNRIALHFGVGTALPYGNADKIPFERRYFSGGANSVRGWSVRSLGPGSMAKDSANFITQAGDIRLDANIEYRTKLFWKFELAAFGDAGNIWTVRPYKEQKHGNFDLSRFYKEIAFSYGMGLRLDFNFVLFRLDVGFKAYDPQEQDGKRWAISHPNFSNNFAWHFGVGYPF